MNKVLQIRRGTSSNHTTFIGLEGEVTLDTDKNTLIVHDGLLAGGYELASVVYLGDNFAPSASTLAGYGILDAYTLTEVDVLLGSKADVGTTINDYGITDAYTSTATDSLLGDKQDVLVSGTNIKTLSSNSLIGSGDLVLSANELADIDTSTVAPTIGQVLKWDLTNWIPADDVDTNLTLSGLSIDAFGDVDTSTAAPSTGDFLKWDSTNWTPQTITPAGIGAEPADGTILKDADIGINVEAYDVSILKYDDIGLTIQPLINYVVKTAVYTAVNGDKLFCDTTTTGAFTVTLPITPTLGDTVIIADFDGNFATANLTVGRNGETIMGAATDLVLSVSNIETKLVFNGADWRAF